MEKKQRMVRYSLLLPEELDDILEELADEKGVTKAEIMRRAVASYSYLTRSTGMEKGLKVSLTNDEDVVAKDIVLP